MNILITSAGRRVSLVNICKNEVTRVLGKESKVFTTDLAPELSAACAVSDKGFKVGRFNEPDYMEVLLDLCKRQDVGLVIPTIDTELKLLAAQRDLFCKNGISIAVSDLEFVTICRDKRLTNKFFSDNGIETPGIIDIENPTYPVFIKPFDGSSSQNIFVIKDVTMLAPFMMNTSRFMHLEYLTPTEHNEYTVDMYYDRDGNLSCLVPRVRIETRGGEVSKGVTRKDSVLEFLKERLPRIKGARGCITLQLMYNGKENQFFGIEINPRFGGGYPISHLAGANYIRLLLEEYLQGKSVSYSEDWEQNLLVLRHDQEISVHNHS